MPETTPQQPGPAGRTQVELRPGLATVCLSGVLQDKLTAAAAAGFRSVEIFEPDLVASPMSPAEVRRRCADLGLSVDLYQPVRDLDSTSAERFEANLRRADRKFAVARELGAPGVLVCSSAAADAVGDPDLLAEQLHAVADRAADQGLWVAYEALAWGRHINTYEASWDVVLRSGHPALGLCLDSFHILSRGSDPSGIRRIPADMLFFLQLADAPDLHMEVLRWSRHHRLFPGQGDWDLPAFLAHVLAAGYRGPLSLEVFNDVFRQADPVSTAVDAHRSLLALREAADLPGIAPGAVPSAPAPSGLAFAEIRVDSDSGPQLANALAGLGFTHTGHHRTKPVQLWSQGDARVLINTEVTRPGGVIGALGLRTADPDRTAARAEALLAPVLPRRRGPGETELKAVAAPDGTEVFFCAPGDDWLGDFAPTGGQVAEGGGGITGIDHVELTQPFDQFYEAGLFVKAVLGLSAQSGDEYAAPFGLVRSTVFTDPACRVRIGLAGTLVRRGEWAPTVTGPQHIAFATGDLLAAAGRARDHGVPMLAIPDNYYQDLSARLEVEPELMAALREFGILYERVPEGSFLHCYTEILGGGVFFELLQRIDGYPGYGVADAPVRMAAHRTARLARAARTADDRRRGPGTA